MTPLADIALADLLRIVEAQYDLRITAPPTILPSGVHSRAWVMDTTRGSWVVKLSNPISDPIPKLQRQTRLLTFLNQHGIRVPQILALRDGSFIATAASNGHHYPVQLMRSEPFSRVEPERASEETLLLVGELAARLHQALEQYPERDAFVADRRKSVNEWGARNEALWPLPDDVPERSLLPQNEQEWLRAVNDRALAYVQQQYPEPTSLSRGRSCSLTRR